MATKNKFLNLNIIAAIAVVIILGVVGAELLLPSHASQLLIGDANSDGTVNISDLSIVAAHFGTKTGATKSTGDLNGDGAVNISDLSVLAAHWGDVQASLPAVPSLTVTATSTSTVGLSWSPDSSSGGTVTYYIYRNGTQVATTTSTTFNDSGLTSNLSYSYTIAASNNIGNSNQSGAVNATTTSSLYSGKLLGMNTSLTATYDSQTTTTGILNQLGVNSMRGEIDFNGTSFGDPNGDGTIANWIDTLTTGGIVPLPLMNQYVELDTLNVTGFASSLTTWCQTYCAGGSFYNGNSAANGTYAPQVLEILNEPYGDWWGYGGPTDADVEAYATLLKDIRTDLNNAGLSNIGITAAANPQSFGSANWDSDMIADGGYAVAQGIVVHPYGLVDLASQTGGSSTDGWGIVYNEHDMLVNAGLSGNIYVTEDGWCTNQAAAPAGYTIGGDCVDNYFLTEAQKDADITTVIGQLASLSWLKGFWYYNLYPYDTTAWNSFGLYEPGTWNGNGLYVSGVATPAWGAFQAAAEANGF